MIGKLKNLDFILLFTVIILTAIGILLIYSSSQGKGGLWQKQLIWAIFSIALLLSSLFINIKSLIFYSPIFFILSLLPLFYLLFFGKKIAGVKSWINFGYFSVQPSEFVKITTALLLAKIISDFRNPSLKIKDILIISFVIFFPLSLILLQPDYGIAFTFLALLASSIFISGIRTTILVFIIIFLLIGGFFTWEYVLKSYHKARILAIFFPEFDPEGSSYQLIQSKIALGSGGLSGTGFLKGTQTKAGFLPTPSTDFILSSAGEEFGFLGILIILFLYTILFLRIFKIMKNIKHRDLLIFVFLIFSIIFFQFFLNVFMVLGFFPVIGIPIPFLSYGGSSLLSLYLSVGLVMSGKLRVGMEE